LKFLLDVHVTRKLAQALAAEGHDVIHAGEIDPTATDAALLERARRDAAVLVTQDSDFSDLVYVDACAAPPAILYLRCDPQDQVDLIPKVLDIHADRLIGNMVVVGRRGSVRLRPLPQASEDHG